MRGVEKLKISVTGPHNPLQPSGRDMYHLVDARPSISFSGPSASWLLPPGLVTELTKITLSFSSRNCTSDSCGVAQLFARTSLMKMRHCSKATC